MHRRVVWLLCACVFLTHLPTQFVRAHDIPVAASVQLYLSASPDGVEILLRAPSASFGEVTFPLRGPGFLDLENVQPALSEVARIYLREAFHVYVDGADLGAPIMRTARIAPPSDRSFADYESASAQFSVPLRGNDIDLFWNQAFFDFQLEYTRPPNLAAIDATAEISLLAATERLASQTQTVLRYLPVDGGERAYTWAGNPGIVSLDPSWWGAFSQFLELGFTHILDGMDHLLFLIALMIPTRRIRALVFIVTSFTVAHTITLISAALGLTPSSLWFPALIETLIALSIVYTACENIFGARQKYRWVLAYAFGLIHGFGFSFILADRLQFASGHLISSLLAFNVGVELGQLLVVLIAVPILALLFRYVLRGARRQRLGIVLLSALVGHSAWHWMTERAAALSQYTLPQPELNAAFFASASRWAILFVGAALVLMLLHEIVNRFAGPVSAAKPLQR